VAAKFIQSDILNPLYCCGPRSILQEKLCGIRIADTDERECKLLREWTELNHGIIASEI